MSCFVWNKSVIIILYTLLQVNIWSCIFKKNITSPAPYVPWHTTTISFHHVTLKSPRPPSRSISFRSLAEQPSLGWTREGRLEWRKWFFCEISWVSGNWNMLLEGNTLKPFFMSVFEKTLHIPTVHILRHSGKCKKRRDGVVLQGTNVVKKKLMASSLPTSTCVTWKVKRMKQFPRWDPPARALFEIDPYIQQKIQVPKISKIEESSPIQAVWIRLM